MEDNINFAEFSEKENEPKSRLEELNSLLDVAFSVSEWLFIARGEHPYCAANTDVMDGQPLIYSFTDLPRLQQFGKENNLADEFGNTEILQIPTRKVIKFLEQYERKGVQGVWFNPEAESGSFVATLQQLHSIREHLAKLNALPKTSFVILHFAVKEGLMMPSADIIPAPYTSHLYWCVPSDWLENREVKTEYLRKIESLMSGGHSENIEGAFYVVTDYSTEILDSEEVKNTVWSSKLADDDNLYIFYLASEVDEISKVTVEEFQTVVVSKF